MKISHFALGLLGSIAAGFVNASAPDQDLTGTYTVIGASLDGSAWTDSSTVITMGQTYALTIDLDYSRFSGSTAYADAQNVELAIGPQAIGSAASGAPSSFVDNAQCNTYPIVGALCTTQRDSASWTLVGELMFDESFGAAGVYDVSLAGGAFQSLTVQAAAVASPVPAPGTLAIFALGLFGLAGARRLKQRR
ncbi:MAG TPA: PEP-CTERM sorting domain-containing protein [Halieaceae bacterium]|jgi:hypothetical protein|uniref:PEP-CTERM sorting domain-containing protein n=1 Tax=Haliea TaxID=475794 RepID=UPI0003FD428A|nr:MULTISPECIES: PEP-CTERM sorting domain-containing protein [Haliea]HBQ39790.1 PEP-CTERM sorting domain-containing protein [Halieaceae bacterium]MAD62009.1 PEP-CTERM sorting domain-containing protein [Haliea sp.]MAY93988.1 PEP-CTERM sorting domain-containing protein [Haliea sp.]MBK41747.1 PEP-CTERM sorting domain-containing protein [Haliea sp.]MBP70559.1 PEP-CTERM sorting domain-containing protein [Haliea sp.]|tara:strand:+ start:63549 stop:64127 length:579 start_codon:yes stop_codon:yes gene_type:complete